MIITTSIDPAYRNFSLTILDNKTSFFVDFFSIRNFFKYLRKFLDFVFEYIKRNFASCPYVIHVIIEKQLEFKKNINLKLEDYLKKCLSVYENIKIIFCPAYLKSVVSLRNFQFIYKKIRSKKALSLFIQKNTKLFQKLSEFTCFTFKFSVKEENNEKSELELKYFIIKKLVNFLELEKWDDLIDTILMIEAKDLI